MSERKQRGEDLQPEAQAGEPKQKEKNIFAVAREIEQREKREEYHHWRQHYRYYPCKYTVNTEYKRSMQIFRRVHQLKQQSQVILEPE